MDLDIPFDVLEKKILGLVGTSPVPELLADTSIVPTYEQTENISAHINFLSQYLIHIQDIIRRSNALTDQLESRKRLHQGLNSGIRTLPAEILSEVFCGRYNDISEEGYSKMIQTQVLASVCRQWRNVALGCAALWSSVTVQAPSAKKGSGQLDWVKGFLARSKGFPLNIVVTWPSYNDVPIPAHALEALELLVAERKRWTSVHIALRDGATLPPFVSMDPDVAGQLPLLRSLDVVGNTKRPRVALSEYGFFYDTPQLESLYVFYAPPPASVPFSWSNLNTFRTSDTIALLTALTVCPQLRVAKREMDDPRHQTDPEEITSTFGDEKIVHENLQRLRFCFGKGRNEVVRLLSLPALDSVALQDYERQDQELLTLLPAFLHTASHLRSLTLELHLDADDLPLFTSILCDCLPFLEDLNLKEDNPPLSLITSDQPFSMISCLEATSTSRPVPRLKRLRYHLFVDDWAEYNTDPEGQPAIFCMICLTALEKVTEEVIGSRYNDSFGVDPLEELRVYVDRVKGLVKPGRFLDGIQTYVREMRLHMQVRFRDVQADGSTIPGGDPLFDEDEDE